MMNISWYREMLGCWSFSRGISCIESRVSQLVLPCYIFQPRAGLMALGRAGRGCKEACWRDDRRLVWVSRMG